MDDVASTERCPILTGRVWAFGLDAPADCIVPTNTDTGADLGGLLMTPVDPDFPNRIEPGDILVAGTFGGGTASDVAVRAVIDAGISAIVASSIDATFAQYAIDAGLPVVEVYEAMGIHTGETLRVDLEGARVVNMSSGNRYPIRNLDETMLQAYRKHLEEAAGEQD